MKRIILFCTVLFIMAMNVMAQRQREGERSSGMGTFCIAKDGKVAAIVVDEQDWKGVVRAANDLGDDVRKVTGTASPVVNILDAGVSGKTADRCILVGTIGKSRVIDKLVKQKKLDVSKVKGQWESFVIDVVDGNLVVAGSDKRGTIYGIYEISQRIGVSPW